MSIFVDSRAIGKCESPIEYRDNAGVLLCAARVSRIWQAEVGWRKQAAIKNFLSAVGVLCLSMICESRSHYKQSSFIGV